jgi:molybdopterin molybdotransferase
MRPFKSTISIDEARRLLRDGVRPIERVDTVALIEAEGRVAAADVQSTIEVPPFARSAMDGYAVVSRDLSGAGSDRPVRMRIVDRVYTGQVPRTRVEPGTAIEIANWLTAAGWRRRRRHGVEETRRAGENAECVLARRRR